LNHTHIHIHHNAKSQQNKLGYAIILNILITAAQVFGGFFSGSLSLLSDALHNLSDVFSLFISYIASILTHRKQTVTKTFGYKRAEIVAAFINTLILIMVAFYLAYESVRRFYEPKEITSIWVICLALLAILFNGFSAIMLNKDAKTNMNIRSSYLHLLSDTITSVAVLIAGVLMYYYKIFWIDAALTIIIATYLIVISWRLLLESLKVLMLFTPSTVVLESINEKITAIPGVQNIHHVHVWQLDNKQIYFEGHVDFADNLLLQDVNMILGKIRMTLHEQFNIDHVTLQPEFDMCHSKDLIQQEQ
jgi:cobalt-zinc-cadmium efflux system protein